MRDRLRQGWTKERTAPAWQLAGIYLGLLGIGIGGGLLVGRILLWLVIKGIAVWLARALG